MKSQFKNSILTLVVIIGLIGLWSCNRSGGNNINVSPHTPGSINAKLNFRVPGGTDPFKCTSQGLTWTASSPAGSTQTKTSPATTTSDNVFPNCSTIEGTTECYCPTSGVSFTSLAPGTWTVQAAGASCSVNVKPGQTSTVNLFADKPCITFP
jgi:hypothetical protein